MDFNDHLAAMGAAIDLHLGEPATWPGVTGPVRVQYLTGDEEVGFEGVRQLMRRQLVLIRKAIIAEPQIDQLITLQASGLVLRIEAPPALDDEGFWVCPVIPVA